MSINHARYKNLFVNHPNLEKAYVKDINDAYEMIHTASRNILTVNQNLISIQRKQSLNDQTLAEVTQNIQIAKQSITNAFEAAIKTIPYVYNTNLVDLALEATKHAYHHMIALHELIRDNNGLQGLSDDGMFRDAIVKSSNARSKSGDAVMLWEQVLQNASADMKRIEQMTMAEKVELKRKRMKQMQMENKQSPTKRGNMVSNALTKIGEVKKKLDTATEKLLKIKPDAYDPATENVLDDEIRNAVNKSWESLVAINDAYSRNANAPYTREKQASEKLYKMYTLLDDAMTYIKEKYKGPYSPHIKRGAYNELHKMLTSAKTYAVEAEQLLSQKSSQEAGGKTRRNKKSRRSHRSRRSRH